MKTHTQTYPRSLSEPFISNFAFNVCLAWVKMVVLAKGFGWNEYVRPRVLTVLLLTSVGTQDHLASQTKTSIHSYCLKLVNIILKSLTLEKAVPNQTAGSCTWGLQKVHGECILWVEMPFSINFLKCPYVCKSMVRTFQARNPYSGLSLDGMPPSLCMDLICF